MRARVSVGTSLILTLAFLVPARAEEPQPRVAGVRVAAGGVEWQPVAEHQDVVLTVSGPEDFYLRKDFTAGIRPIFEPFTEAGQPLPDGVYTWEMKTVAGKRRQLLVETGAFTILNGALVPSNLREEEGPAAKRRGGAGLRPTIAEDQQIADDLSVFGNACVGVFCLNPETYGDDTLKLKKQVVRLLFEDTSTGSGIPSTDWRLTANDTSSGGANRFSIEDATAGTVPFTVRGGAPTNSLFVASNGRVGIHTANPTSDLQITSPVSPMIRFEQDGSSWFPYKIWDVLANSDQFVIGTLAGEVWPFRVRTNAPNNSFIIASNGNVGINAATPDAKLDVEGSGSVEMRLTLTGSNVWRIVNDFSGLGIILNGSGLREFNLGGGGNLTIAGTLTQGSSRDLKDHFATLDPKDVLARVSALPVSLWSYKTDGPSVRHLGPMAEDFHQAFGLGADDKGIAPGDTAGVALAAVQGLNQVVQEKDREIAELKGRIEALEKLVEGLAKEE